MSEDGQTRARAVLAGTADVRIAPADPRDPAVRDCLRQYYDELAQRFRQGFDVSLSRDPEADDMLPPRGIFLMAWSGHLPMGCAGLKGLGNSEAEVKRVWVAPAARRMGLARRLMVEIEARAVALGIRRLMLDTNSTLAEAVALYRKTGWVQIDRFNDDPYPDAFFEKCL